MARDRLRRFELCYEVARGPISEPHNDARAAAKHIAMSPAAYINGGKHLLGHDLSTIPF